MLQAFLKNLIIEIPCLERIEIQNMKFNVKFYL